MSRKERNRLTIMVGIKRKELTLLEAGQLMAISYRQARRVNVNGSVNGFVLSSRFFALRAVVGSSGPEAEV